MDLEGSVEQMEQLNLVAGGELTISSGAVTVTHSLHSIDTEGDAVTDDLNTINGGSAGDVLLIGRANAARAVVLKHNAGNIKTPSGTDHELTANGFVMLKHDGSNWHVQSGNGSGYALNKLACLTVATSNITLNDTQTMNGVFCGADSRVFLAGQTDPTENGPWIVKEENPYYPNSGDWIRPDDFQDGFSVSGHLFYIESGTSYSDSVWMITNHYGEDIVGTDDLNAVNLGGGGGSAFDLSTLPEDSSRASTDYFTKHDGGRMEKIGMNDLLRDGLHTMTDGATITLNLANPERIFSVTLGGNRTLAVTNATVGDRFILKLVQDGTGSRTVTWWSTINWTGGSAPTLTTTAEKADYFEFVCWGANTFDCIRMEQNLDTSTGGSTSLSSNIVSNWELDYLIDDEFTDSVASLNLVPSASPASSMLAAGGVSGAGGAATFDGTQYLRVPVNAASPLNFEDSSFTIALWVKPDAIGTSKKYLSLGTLSIQDDGANRVSFYMPGTSKTFSGADMTTGAWQLIVCAYDSVNNLMKISRNGAAYETAAQSTGAAALSDGYLYVGSSTTPDAYYDGELDSLTIWSKALSQAEVTELYNSGSGKFYPFAS
ncbi:LamG domain-containing protein [Gimesia chilikensis]|nr:LamG domain-containing protein [Gimesia chilikensis]